METPLFPNHRTIIDAMKVQQELEGKLQKVKARLATYRPASDAKK
jgi:hypothetical protein